MWSLRYILEKARDFPWLRTSEVSQIVICRWDVYGEAKQLLHNTILF
jgi:hypothetical protein